MRLDEPIAKTLINAVLKRQNWTIHDLAKELGVTANSVWRMRRGTITPSSDKLFALAYWAGRDPAEVLLRRAEEQKVSDAQRCDQRRMRDQHIAANLQQATRRKEEPRAERPSNAAPMTPNVLRALRNGMGLMQRELAERLGVTENTVTRWENGRRKIPPVADRLVRVLAAMHSGLSGR
jgi:transcriptional regulator with XRE-family HTH domain